MYKIGNQYIILKAVFSVSKPFIRDGCTIEVNIHSVGGAKVIAIFKSLPSDNCQVDGGCSQSFVNRTNNDVDQLINLITQIEYKS